jgi:hypothetical protein
MAPQKSPPVVLEQVFINKIPIGTDIAKRKGRYNNNPFRSIYENCQNCSCFDPDAVRIRGIWTNQKPAHDYRN